MTLENFKLNNQLIHFCPFGISQLDKLITYLTNLSPESRNRFGPHAYTKEAIIRLLEDYANYRLYVALNPEDDTVVAYTIIKIGWLDFDSGRLSSYGLAPVPSDCTIAPSVADRWQSHGIGSEFFNYIVEELKANFKINRIILWGGVQATNQKAINFYKKFGFRTLGDFEHNGMNYDMLVDL